MTLVWLILVPLLGGLAAWLAAGFHEATAKLASLVALAGGLVLTGWIGATARADGPWLEELDLAWLPDLGVRFHLALDGLSLPLVALAFAIGLVAVAASWSTVHARVGLFLFCTLTTVAAVNAVFLAMDLVLFYFAWEAMLVPMYLLIGIWGYERRLYAAIKFFLFTQASGLLLLLAILGLHVAHRAATGVATFDYEALLGTPLGPTAEVLLMLGFFVAFAVKVPVVPLHTWLADAHTQAPTGGSVLLAGILLKTGGYGLIRFVVPLFPRAAAAWASVFMVLGVVGVLVGAWLAFAQTDAKRLVAYTSVSHMGFVVLAVFAWNEIALQGAVLEMICHGLATGALFVVVGMLYERTGTRDLRELGGLWASMPRFGGVTLFFALAALGLPGLGNFVAEWLCLFGAWPASPSLAVLGAAGLVLAAVYALWFVQRTFHGAPTVASHDLRAGEAVLYGAMAAALLWLGLAPQPVLDVAQASIVRLVAGGPQ